MQNASEASILEQVHSALNDKRSLSIKGGHSKQFYGRTPMGDELDISVHSGIVSYEPSELVITAKAGTKIKQVQSELAQNAQMLGFDPPFCTENSTLGGVVAAGLAGPRRPFSGAVRDFILGVKMINGRAQVLKFGGQVMKNVAGFDHSRLMAGSLGTLGVLLEISLRVVPMVETEVTLSIEQHDADKAIELMNRLAGKPYPLSAAAWLDKQLKIRLSGTENGVNSAVKQIGGDLDLHGEAFWFEFKEHKLTQFESANVVYQASLPPASAAFGEAENQILDWGGAQRWLFDLSDIEKVNKTLKLYGGHLTVFRGGNRDQEVFQTLDPAVMHLHQNLKRAFDPQGIFNPGRMYKGL